MNNEIRVTIKCLKHCILKNPNIQKKINAILMICLFIYFCHSENLNLLVFQSDGSKKCFLVELPSGTSVYLKQVR